MEWEKEGAESWALPHYGPSRVLSLNTTNTRDEPDYKNETEGENLLLKDDCSYHSGQFDSPSTKPETPAGSLSFSTSAATESVGSAPATPRGNSAKIEWQANNNRTPSTLNQDLSGQGKALADAAAGFRPGSYGVPKGRGGGPIKRLPQTPRKRKPAELNYRSKIMISRKDFFGKAKWREGVPPDASMRLPCDFKVFEERLANLPQRPLINTNLCDRINQQTGAHVMISANSVKHIDIWGKESQVLAAQRMVQGFVNELGQLKRHDEPPGWDKIKAHSKTQVATQKYREHSDAKRDGLRKAPKIPIDCTLIFLWPQHGPSLSHCFVSRRQMLDEMRMLHDVHIYTKSGAQDLLFLSGDNEVALRQISNEIREIWRGLFVQCETEVKMFLVDPPILDIMKTSVVLERVNELGKAFLFGSKIPGNEADAWDVTAQGIKNDNKTAISEHLERALQLVPHFDGVRQMRANFGSFILEEWEKPQTGNKYSFEEFRGMIRQREVQGRLLPGLRLSQEEILKRIMKAKDFFVPWGAEELGSLMEIVPRHSANFEYRVGGDSIIQVEVNFSLPGSGEFETNRIRCFRPRKIGTQGNLKMPMQIGMIDFERSDWQFEVKALSLYQEDDFKVALDRFRRSIAYRYNSSVRSIGSNPVRKAQFSPGMPVTRFVEKSAIQLRVIGTPYVFELSRFDEYISVQRGQWPKIPKVFWGGSLFNPEWDDILGEERNLDMIADIANVRPFSRFFPPSPQVVLEAKKGMDADEAAEKHEEICKEKEIEQMRDFMGKVQIIARMLGSPDDEMPEVLETEVGTLF